MILFFFLLKSVQVFSSHSLCLISLSEPLLWRRATLSLSATFGTETRNHFAVQSHKSCRFVIVHCKYSYTFNCIFVVFFFISFWWSNKEPDLFVCCLVRCAKHTQTHSQRRALERDLDPRRVYRFHGDRYGPLWNVYTQFIYIFAAELEVRPSTRITGLPAWVVNIDLTILFRAGQSRRMHDFQQPTSDGGWRRPRRTMPLCCAIIELKERWNTK